MILNGERPVCVQLPEVPFLHRAVMIDNKAEIHDIRVGFIELFSERVQKTGEQVVVAVDEQHILAARALDPGVPRVAEAAVLFVDYDGFLRRFGGKPVAQRTALAVGRAVVHEQDLKVVSALIQNRAETGSKIVFDVINGNNEAESHHSASLSHRRKRTR